MGAELASFKGGQRSAWPLWKRWDPYHAVRYCHLKCLAHALEAAFCLCVFSSKHQGHCGLFGQRAPRVSAPAFRPIPYLSMHKGGLFLGPRVCLLGGGGCFSALGLFFQMLCATHFPESGGQCSHIIHDFFYVFISLRNNYQPSLCLTNIWGAVISHAPPTGTRCKRNRGASRTIWTP